MKRAVPIALIALWLAAVAVSFATAFPIRMAHAGAPISLAGIMATLAPAQLIFNAAGALIAGRALAELAGQRAARVWLLLIAGILAVGSAFLLPREPFVPAGMLIGCALWWLIARWREPGRGTVVVLLALAAYAAHTLLPFEIRYVPATFNLVPFAALLRGPTNLETINELLMNLLVFAGMLGALQMNGSSPVPGSIALAVLVTLFESLHLLIGNRAPDITQPLLVLIVGQLMSLASAGPGARRARSTHTPMRPEPGPLASTPRLHAAAAGYARGSDTLPVHGFVIAAYVALILYASLYPLTGWRIPAGPWWHFLTLPWPHHFSRSDVVSNVLAYVPLGAMLGWRFRTRKAAGAAIVVATLLGTLLSLSVETTQVLLPSRTASTVDLATNALGTAIGAALAMVIRANAGPFRALMSLREEWLLPGRHINLAFAAFVLWIMTQWSPFVPSLDLSGVRHGLEPIWHTLHNLSLLRPYATAAYALDILGLGLLVGSLLKPGRPLIIPFAITAGFVIAAKAVIVSRQLSLEATLGLVLAMLMLVPIRIFSRRAWIWISAICLLAGFAAAELSPGVGGFKAFNWRPFAGELDNNLNGFANIMAGVWPFLALGSLAGLLTPAHRRSVVAATGALAVIAFSFLMEWVQHYLPGRYGDITTVLLAAGGWMVAWWSPTAATHARHRRD